jgi:hypothetical protein
MSQGLTKGCGEPTSSPKVCSPYVCLSQLIAAVPQIVNANTLLDAVPSSPQLEKPTEESSSLAHGSGSSASSPAPIEPPETPTESKPFERSSASWPNTSASYTNTSYLELTSQEIMRRRVKRQFRIVDREIKTHVVAIQVPALLGALFAKPTTHDEYAIDELYRSLLGSIPFRSSQSEETLPHPKKPEMCVLLNTWLNEILALVRKEQLSPPASVVSRTFRFDVHDPELVDQGDGAASLPDLVARFREVPSKKIYWQDVFIPVVVKRPWSSLRIHAHMHARNIWATQPRLFVMVLMFNRVQLDWSLGVYDRAHYFESASLSMVHEEGVKTLIRTLRSIVFADSNRQIGLDPTISGDEIELESYGKWEMTRAVYQHLSLIGRDTRVCIARPSIPMPYPLPTLSALKADEVVVKTSWQPTARHKNEREMYCGIGALVHPTEDGEVDLSLIPFGLPAFLKSYPVREPGSSSNITTLCGEGIGVGVDPDRVLVRTVLLTIGTSLREASGPRELARAVVHAMIGSQ